MRDDDDDDAGAGAAGKYEIIYKLKFMPTHFQFGLT